MDNYFSKGEIVILQCPELPELNGDYEIKNIDQYISWLDLEKDLEGEIGDFFSYELVGLKEHLFHQKYIFKKYQKGENFQSLISQAHQVDSLC